MFKPTPMPGEVWADVVGYSGHYWVSTYGRVVSKRVLLKPAPIDKYGRLAVSLSLNGVRKTYGVHVLVMRAFVGPAPDGLQICHNDGDVANNRLDNLRYDTAKNNQRDILKHGRHRGRPWGSKDTRPRKPYTRRTP